jgi:hypothetical protein
MRGKTVFFTDPPWFATGNKSKKSVSTVGLQGYILEIQSVPHKVGKHEQDRPNENLSNKLKIPNPKSQGSSKFYIQSVEIKQGTPIRY